MDFKRARNESQIDKRRKDILKACKKSFISNGYDDTTLLSVANLTNIGRTTIYNYFPTKEDMFLELFNEEAIRLVHDMENQYEDVHDDKADAFYQMLLHIFHNYKPLFQYHAVYLPRTIDKAEKATMKKFKESTTTPFKEIFRKWLLLVNPKLSEEKIELASKMLFCFLSGLHAASYHDEDYEKVCDAFAKSATFLIKNSQN